ncbi:prepilin-type N-terminal cleavage/methylation domain-containing protein [Acinetobacter wanghuae]|uniref:Prepilin-type N-terminal cleavage/methylation domain-containing protein n=1 Tax=Acinetobacter wanghuae TaxID=2662362 RepID=A0ABX6D7J9_9GAMM|nr:PilW family protein [Acinetobacter wanghuae]QGA11987.1 prepilin-type N-terminal cleavage/methylation domain-containing protein [Acinetobacter wanghuae]
MINYKKIQRGFTLLELMIALVLGLLIIAAALALFMNAQKSMNFQSGMSSLQQNANFGLAQMAHEIRHANLNTPSEQKINNKDIGSGVIFAASNLPTAVGSGADSKYFTRFGLDNDDTNLALGSSSDQLTIQFVPDIRGDEQYDCEGIKIITGRTYVYRYYLDKLPNEQQIPGALDRYGLYCDAGYYYTTTSTEVVGLGAQGQLVLQNVDAFKIRFLVKNPAKQLRYVTIQEYLDNLMPDDVTDKQDYHSIGAVEIGLLIASSESIGSDSRFNTQATYKIAGQDITLKPNTKNSQYLRQPITQVVSFRNTLGAF